MGSGNGNFTLFGPGGSTSGGGGGGSLAVNTYSSGPQTLTTANQVIYVDGTSGGFTVNLYTAIGNAGLALYFERTDLTLANVITIDANGSETIDGALTVTLNTQFESYILISDGSNWHIHEHRTECGPIDLGTTVIHSTGEYTFTISSASIVTGDTYTNNGQTFTVTTATGTVTTLATYGTGAPASSGTLTRASGSGAATLTFSSVATSLPAKPSVVVKDRIYLERNGAFGKFRGTIYWTSATGAAAGNGSYLFKLGGSLATLLADITTLSPDTTLNNTSAAMAAACVGFGREGTNTNSGVGTAHIYNSGYVALNYYQGLSSVGYVSSSFLPFTTAQECLYWEFEIPISGWVA